MIALLLTIVLFTSAGYASSVLWRFDARSSIAERVAEAFLRGIGVVGVLLFVLGLVRIPLSRPLFIAVFVLFFAAGLLALREQPPAARRAYPQLPSALVLLPFLAVACNVAVSPLADWDGLITWVPKARAIAVEHSIVGTFFFGAAGMNLHNHYPLLLPLDGAMLMGLAGTTADTAVRWLYALLPLSFLLMMRGRLAARFDAHASAWITAVIAWLPLVLQGAVSAYGDLAVAAFAGAALFALIARAPADFAAWSAFLILTKNEGILLFAALLATAAVVRLLTTLRQWLIATAIPLLSFFMLQWWRSIVPDAYDERYGVLVRDLPHRLDHLGAAAGALLRYAIAPAAWGFLWPIAVLAALAVWRDADHPGRRATAAAALFVVFSMAGYTLIYAVTSWDIGDLARVSADRLLSHALAALAVMLTAGLSLRLTSRIPAPGRA